MSGGIVVITPVHNEAAHLAAVVASVCAQTRPPDRWIVVDDRSTDGTLELARDLATDTPFMEVVTAGTPVAGGSADPLATAREAQAFMAALEQQRSPSFDYVGKLDGDIVLDPDHFELLLAELEADANLGIVGCALEEYDRGRWVEMPIPDYHVHGAVKLYRRTCLEHIGGIEVRLGWDTLDELRARMAGYETRTITNVRARHLRASASASGVLRGRARHGACAWVLGYPAWLVLSRAVGRELCKPPVLAGALAYSWGFVRSAAHDRRPLADAPVRAFARAEQRKRMRAAVRARVAPRAPSPADRGP